MYFDSDDDDDDLPDYADDEFIQLLVKDIQDQISGKIENPIDWPDVIKRFGDKINTIGYDPEKIDYICAVVRHCDYIAEIVQPACRFMHAISPHLSDIESVITCSAFCGYYSQDTEIRHAALHVLENVYADCDNDDDRLSALTTLLNDDRPFDINSTKRFDQHKKYFDTWCKIMEDTTPDIVSEASYRLLQPLKMYNEFKPITVSMIFSYIEECTNPLTSLEMILFCNRTITDPIVSGLEVDDDKGYPMSVDPEYLPHMMCDWENAFFMSANRLINQWGFNPAVNTLDNMLQQDDYKSWTEVMWRTISGIQIVLDLERNVKNQAIEPYNIQDDPLNNPEKYYDLANDLYMKSTENSDSKEWQNQCLTEFRKTYQGLQNYGSVNYSERTKKLEFDKFKANVLLTAIHGNTSDPNHESSQNILSFYARDQLTMLGIISRDNLSDIISVREFERAQRESHKDATMQGPQGSLTDPDAYDSQPWTGLNTSTLSWYDKHDNEVAFLNLKCNPN